MSQKTRSIVAAFALALLTAGAASALPLGPRPLSAQDGSSSFAAVWDWLSSLAGGLGTLWEQEGSSMDPNGLNKAGSQMDPDGLNAAGCPGDAGSQMDPDGASGRCSATGTSLEAGSQMDPDGLR
jgi:hypothetical protein